MHEQLNERQARTPVGGIADRWKRHPRGGDLIVVRLPAPADRSNMRISSIEAARIIGGTARAVIAG